MADITPPSSQQNTPQPSIGKTLPNPDPAAMDVDLDESESIASEGCDKILVPSGAERAEQVGQVDEADADEIGDEGDEEIEVEDEAEAEVGAEDEEKGKPEKKGKAPLGGPVGVSLPRQSSCGLTVIRYAKQETAKTTIQRPVVINTLASACCPFPSTDRWSP